MSKDHPDGTLKSHFTLRHKTRPDSHGETRPTVQAEGDKLTR